MGLDQKIFAERLREVRLKAGMPGAALAEGIGVKRQAIVNLETGHRSPSTDTLYDLARALGVSTDFLLGLSQPGPPERPVPDWVETLLLDLARLDKTGQTAVKVLVKGLAK